MDIIQNNRALRTLLTTDWASYIGGQYRRSTCEFRGYVLQQPVARQTTPSILITIKDIGRQQYFRR
jgi:hypothetical protein